MAIHSADYLIRPRTSDYNSSSSDNSTDSESDDNACQHGPDKLPNTDAEATDNAENNATAALVISDVRSIASDPELQLHPNSNDVIDQIPQANDSSIQPAGSDDSDHPSDDDMDYPRASAGRFTSAENLCSVIVNRPDSHTLTIMPTVDQACPNVALKPIDDDATPYEKFRARQHNRMVLNYGHCKQCQENPGKQLHPSHHKSVLIRTQVLLQGALDLYKEPRILDQFTLPIDDRKSNSISETDFFRHGRQAYWLNPAIYDRMFNNATKRLTTQFPFRTFNRLSVKSTFTELAVSYTDKDNKKHALTRQQARQPPVDLPAPMHIQNSVPFAVYSPYRTYDGAFLISLHVDVDDEPAAHLQTLSREYDFAHRLKMISSGYQDSFTEMAQIFLAYSIYNREKRHGKPNRPFPYGEPAPLADKLPKKLADLLHQANNSLISDSSENTPVPGNTTVKTRSTSTQTDKQTLENQKTSVVRVSTAASKTPKTSPSSQTSSPAKTQKTQSVARMSTTRNQAFQDRPTSRHTMQTAREAYQTKAPITQRLGPKVTDDNYPKTSNNFDERRTQAQYRNEVATLIRRQKNPNSNLPSISLYRTSVPTYTEWKNDIEKATVTDAAISSRMSRNQPNSREESSGTSSSAADRPRQALTNHSRPHLTVTRTYRRK